MPAHLYKLGHYLVWTVRDKCLKHALTRAQLLLTSHNLAAELKHSAGLDKLIWILGFICTKQVSIRDTVIGI